MTYFDLIKPGTLTVGTYIGFAPVSWRDDNGIARGRDLDFLRAFAEQWKLNIVFHFFPFDQLWKRPGDDEVDIAAAGIAPLEPRQTKDVVWSEPYYTVQRSLLIRAIDREQYKTMANFSGKRIMVTSGSTAQLDTEQRKPHDAIVVYYDGNQSKMVSELLNGSVDAVAEGDICSKYLANKCYPDQLSVADVHSMNEPENFVFAVRKASMDLLKALNEFIGEHRHEY